MNELRVRWDEEDAEQEAVMKNREAGIRPQEGGQMEGICLSVPSTAA